MPLVSLIAKHSDMFSPHFSGFGCGEGWAALIDDAINELRRRCPSARITAAKEKMGTLRIYVEDKLDPVAKEVLRRAEELSAATCDVCGGAGHHFASPGWVRTRCDAHEES